MTVVSVPETTLVKGYYPDSINYALIPEPFIEIENSAQVLDKQMCVVDEVYQEYVTPDSVLLEQGKQTKINQLKANRVAEMEVKTPKPSSLQIYKIDGVFRTFKIKISDIAILNSRIIRLQNAVAGTTAQWTDIDNNRLDLTLEQFKTLANHLDDRDQNLFTFYTEKLNEINAISIDGEYFDENQEPISALQALENININLI